MLLSYALTLPNDVRYVTVVRHLCVNTLTELGVLGACVDDVALAVTEACANVVQHAGGAGGADGADGEPSDFQVRVVVEDLVCRIEVVDRGAGTPPGPRPAADAVEELLTHGRGLELMRILVDRMDFRPDEAGTTVVLVKDLRLAEGSVLAATS